MVEWQDLPALDAWPRGAIGGLRLAVAPGAHALLDAVLEEDARVVCRYEALAWKEPSIRITARTMVDTMAELVVLHGPGRLALTCTATGVALPLALAPGAAIQVRRRALLLATAAAVWAPMPAALPDFVRAAAVEETLLLLGGRGGMLGVTLGERESVDVAPGALLYVDDEVTLEPIAAWPAEDTGVPPLTLVRCGGPGRLAIQTRASG